MNLTVANVTTKVAQSEFEAAVEAISKQLQDNFFPEWRVTANLHSIALALDGKKAPVQLNADAVIYLGDSSDDPTIGVKGAFGYHSANNKKIPYGFAISTFALDTKRRGPALCRTKCLNFLLILTQL